MKKVVYFLMISFLILSCSIHKKPIFIKVDNVQVLQYATDTIKLKADVFFENPNNVSGKLTTDSIYVFVNNIKLARVSAKEFKVPVRKEFAIPMLVEIPTQNIWKNNKNGFIGGLLNSVLNKAIKVQFKGDLTYKFLGFSRIYKIDNTQELQF